jgi:hypothetical protein
MFIMIVIYIGICPAVVKGKIAKELGSDDI